MVSGFSNYLNNKILNLFFGRQTFAVTDKFWIGLLTELPSEDQTNGVELTAVDYVRKEIKNNPTNFPSTSTGVKTNGVGFEFPPTEEVWSGIIGVGFFDDPEEGHIWGWAQIPTTSVAVGDVLRIPAGGLTLGFLSLGKIPAPTDFAYDADTTTFSWGAVNIADTYLLRYQPVDEDGDWTEVSNNDVLVYDWEPPEGDWRFQILAVNGDFISDPAEIEVNIS